MFFRCWRNWGSVSLPTARLARDIWPAISTRAPASKAPTPGTSFRAFAPEARKANQKFVELLRSVGKRRKATPAQIALAWMLAQKPWIIPLFGTRNLGRFNENVGALSLKLSTEELREIDGVSSTFSVQGARYPEDMLRRSGL